MNKEEKREIDEKVKDFKEDDVQLEIKVKQLEEDVRLLKEKNREEEFDNRLHFGEKLNEVFTSAPTHKPKNFKEQFAFYKSGAEYRLYVFIDGSWKYEILT